MTPQPSLWRFLTSELAFPAAALPKFRVSTSKLSESYAFLLVPWRLEHLLCHGFIICLDAFLFFLTLLPLRFLWALGRLGLRSLRAGRGLSAEEADDLFRGSLLALVLVLLWLPPWTDYSTVYHFVRGESVLKLYVIFNVLDVFDKLCCAFGQDVLDAVLFAFLYTDLRRIWCCLAFLAAALYVCGHALIIFLQLITLNVALNSENNALFTLLVSSNFVELKSNVFKRCGKENLFQISCSDIVERFQIALYVCILLVQNLRGSQFGGAQTAHITMVLGGEVLTDYIKHAFIMKFNNLQPSLYSKFEQIICLDVLESRTAEQRHSILGQWMAGEGSTARPTISRRIGLVIIPSVALFLRTCFEALPDIFPLGQHLPFTALCLGLGYASLLVLKVFTSIVTVGHSCKMLLSIPPNITLQMGEAPAPTKPDPKAPPRGPGQPSPNALAADGMLTQEASTFLLQVASSIFSGASTPVSQHRRAPYFPSAHGSLLDLPSVLPSAAHTPAADRRPAPPADPPPPPAADAEDSLPISREISPADSVPFEPNHPASTNATPGTDLIEEDAGRPLNGTCGPPKSEAKAQAADLDGRPPHPKPSSGGAAKALFPPVRWLDPDDLPPLFTDSGAKAGTHLDPGRKKPPKGDEPEDDFQRLAAVHRYGLVDKRIV